MSSSYLSRSSGIPLTHDVPYYLEYIMNIMNAKTEDIDPESAALIVQLAIEDIEGESKPGAPSAEDMEIYVPEMQCESLPEWITCAQDAIHAKSTMSHALNASDAVFLNALRIAEEAAVQNRCAEEMSHRGQAIPKMTSAQKRVGEKGHTMHPEPELEIPLVIVHGKGKKRALEHEEDAVHGNKMARVEGGELWSEDISDLTVPVREFQAQLVAALLAGIDGAAEELDEPLIILSDTAQKQALDDSEEVSPDQEKGKSHTNGVGLLRLFGDFMIFTVPVRKDLGQLPAAIFGIPDDTGLSSVEPSAGSSVLGKRMVQCTICADELRFDKALHTPCDHYYCGECVTYLVERATHDEDLYPVRCCLQPIPITSLNGFISPALQETFAKKCAEYIVPVKNRVFCASRSCLAFLGSSEGLNAIGIACTMCASSTCTKCKQAEHAGECVEVEVMQLRALASTKGWKTCPGCKWLVERTEGCPHMTCRCTFQFCYSCGVKWGKCKCP